MASIDNKLRGFVSVVSFIVLFSNHRSYLERYSVSLALFSVFQALSLSGQAKVWQARENIERRLVQFGGELVLFLASLVFFFFSFFFQPCSFVPSLTLNPSPNPSSRPYELRAWNRLSHSRLELLLERYCKLLRNLGEEFLLRD